MFSLLMALHCPNVIMINLTNEPWSKHDKMMLSKAKKRCGELYSNARCVKTFKKLGFQEYSVICGAE